MTAARVAVVIAAFCAMSHAHAQRATERYIPLGQSPGVSQKLTLVGQIAQVDASSRTLTILEPAGRRAVQITDRTRIWLDRTRLKLPNQTGSFADLQKGRVVEVKLQGPERRPVADWVKVEIALP